MQSEKNGAGHNLLIPVVRFYNDRDLRPACADPVWTRMVDAEREGCWPGPEVAENVNHDELGNLDLSEQEMDDIVAFMKTLTDGWKP